MEDVADHHIDGLHHPAVSMGNRKPARHRFQWWIHGSVITGSIPSGVEIRQNKDQLDLRIPFLLLPQNRSRQTVKGPVAAQVKGSGTLLNQALCYGLQPVLQRLSFCNLCMAAKGHIHG